MWSTGSFGSTKLNIKLEAIFGGQFRCEKSSAPLLRVPRRQRFREAPHHNGPQQRGASAFFKGQAEFQNLAKTAITKAISPSLACFEVLIWSLVKWKVPGLPWGLQDECGHWHPVGLLGRPWRSFSPKKRWAKISGCSKVVISCDPLPGLLNFYRAKEGYLQGQIGNPEGEDKPNKSHYDPRKWIRAWLTEPK